MGNRQIMNQDVHGYIRLLDDALLKAGTDGDFYAKFDGTDLVIYDVDDNPVAKIQDGGFEVHDGAGGGAVFDIDASGNVTAAADVAADTVTVGGGAGGSGADLNADGSADFDGAVTADSVAVGGGAGGSGSDLNSDGTADFDGKVTVGGGYGGSGIDLNADGSIDADGEITTDGALTLGGFLTFQYEDVGISSGVLTITKSFVRMNGEGSADDDLDTISGAPAGTLLVLRPLGSVTITLKHGTGNINTQGAGDVALQFDRALLWYENSNWWLMNGITW